MNVLRKRSRKAIGVTPVDTFDESKVPSKPVRRILLLLAHPSLDRSEANRPMADAAVGIDGMTLIDLYAEYPDF